MTATYVWTNGMGSGGIGWGFASDVAWGLGDEWDDIMAEFKGAQFARKIWQFGVAYPALAFPMGNSVRTGVINTCACIRAVHVKGTPLFVGGYSEGAMVANIVWRDHILNPNGDLHDFYDDVADFGGIILFGDPMRCPGIANGNVIAGFPVPGKWHGVVTGGISGPLDLKPEETPYFVLSCTNPGDVYGSSPQGADPWTKQTGIGYDESLIFKLVQDFNMANILGIAVEVFKVMPVVADLFSPAQLIKLLVKLVATATGDINQVPVTGATTPEHVIDLLFAVYNFGLFSVGQAFGPHGDYAKMVPGIVNWMNARVAKWEAAA